MIAKWNLLLTHKVHRNGGDKIYEIYFYTQQVFLGMLLISGLAGSVSVMENRKKRREVS